jgi:hypothetical protein
MSSGGGGSRGVLGEAQRGFRRSMDRWRKDPWGENLTMLSDILSAGVIKHRDGKFSDGRAIQITKELGGAPGKREAQYAQEELLRQEEAKMKLDLQNKNLEDYRADVQSSRQAQSIRTTAAARSSTKRPTQRLGSDDESEFLGL